MKESGMSGLAVLEGILVKNENKYALAVRKPDNDIEVLTGRFNDISGKNTMFNLPFVRGIVNFIDTICLGVKNFSMLGKFYDKEDGEGDKGDTLQLLIVMAIISLAIALFIALPYGISLAFEEISDSELLLTLVEGGVRIGLLALFVICISLFPDIKRMYMYLGAQHKAMNCVDKGLPLTMTNVKKMGKKNYKCATTFLYTVIMLSIIFFMFIRVDNLWLRILIRLLIVPVIASVTYEVMNLASNSDSIVIKVLNLPAMLIHSIITSEPEEEMIEVAIESLSVVGEDKVEENELAEFDRDISRQPINSKNKIKRVSRDKPQKQSKTSSKQEVTAKKKKLGQKQNIRIDLSDLTEKKMDKSLSMAQRAKQTVSIKDDTKKSPSQDDEDDEILNALNHFFNSKKEEEKHRGKKR